MTPATPAATSGRRPATPLERAKVTVLASSLVLFLGLSVATALFESGPVVTVLWVLWVAAAAASFALIIATRRADRRAQDESGASRA